ncbi:alpha-ketoacid dehydrogenase subunit beta [Sphingomonas sp. MG17]|uniref:Alpha-ketoacid dehydrogenase subunit beta n=1 Tax=Sphingomonas tagetis TaxID=2949092 RepID=A0A9X2KP50_9SPHN|nr:alpha-ketoacid dehydrogenase subunit beta [Sphingomonas tagetis]MCP3730288.1 alpha-ketoacid dehydrogenase subunit beta [Sphingomonas tagetis]
MHEEMNLIAAINHTLRSELIANERLRIVGYDIGPVGGMFRATDNLFDEFGEDRVVDTPLTENGIMGMAVGMAIAGDRPVLEMQFLGFMYNAWGQLIYHLSNLHQKTGGAMKVPVTIRAVFGGGIKPLPFHSESTEAWLMHTPGIRVICPSTPYQAKGLLLSSLRCDDPVVFLEHSKLYRAFREPVPTGDYLLPLDKCRIVQPGEDLTVLTWGNMVHVSTEAARQLGASIELIDLVSLSPIDVEPILASVKKTGRCVVVHEARRTSGPGAELIALINEYALEWLKAPVKRVTGFDVAFPDTSTEDFYLPGVGRAKAAFEAILNFEF